MTSMCYPNVLQAQLDEYCSKAGLNRILVSDGAEDALKAVLNDRPTKADPSLPSLRRAVIARLSYCTKVVG